MCGVQKSVLIVEDDEGTRGILAEMISCATMEAETLLDAEEAYESFGSTFAAIILDGHIGGGTTVSLVEWVRTKGYQGPIIAHSDDEDIQTQLMSLGCTYDCPKGNDVALRDALTKIGVLIVPPPRSRRELQ